MNRTRLNKVLRVRNQNAAIAYQRKLKVMHQSYTNILQSDKETMLVDLSSTFLMGPVYSQTFGSKTLNYV